MRLVVVGEAVRHVQVIAASHGFCENGERGFEFGYAGFCSCGTLKRSHALLRVCLGVVLHPSLRAMFGLLAAGDESVLRTPSLIDGPEVSRNASAAVTVDSGV